MTTLFSDAEIRRMEREDAALVEELGGERSSVAVHFYDHLYNPLDVGETLLGPNPDGKADYGFNVACIPSGLYLAGGTRWHPTDETRVVEADGEALVVTAGRMVPHLVAEVEIESKPSFVNVPAEVKHEGGGTAPIEEHEPLVTKAELVAAREEARAMREADGYVAEAAKGKNYRAWQDWAWAHLWMRV